MDLNVLLNQSEIREGLREQLPKIDKLESLDGLRDLRLTGINAREDGFFEKGIASKNKIVRLRVRNEGTSNEYEEVQISFSSAQTILKVYNPDYQG